MMRKSISSLLFILCLCGIAAAQSSMVMNKPLYPEGVDAKKEVREALAKAKAQNKRVLLVFGADWCYDCHVLEYRFHQPEIQPIVDKNYIVVHINIGQGEVNVDLANKYQIPLNRGVPSVAVVTPAGAVLYSTQHGEISPTRRLSPEYIINFLKQWAPHA